ncbi:MAG: OmpA family protein [Paludibacteraceae bacterium]|nr:OmpA family protein [Paludibacteraceae bacterium]
MNKHLILTLATAMTVGVAQNASAQWLKSLGDKAAEAAKRTVERNVENKTEKAVDDALNPKFNKKGKSSNKNNEEYAAEEDVQQPSQPTKKQKVAQGEEMKSDFVPGSVVIFEDNLQGEQMGEFPSKWDLIDNNAEVARMNGKMAIKFEHGSNTEIMPLIKDGNKTYLPDFYTLEFDFFATGKEGTNSAYNLHLNPTEGDRSSVWFSQDRMNWRIMKPNGDELVEGNASLVDVMELNDWNHFALSFNKRALKVYVNGKRIINIPNAKAMDWFSFQTEFWDDHIDYITNVRLAKGGVELYERNAQSMTPIEKAIAETGKFVTNNILFETGKATLKPESMAEIQKVADYMKKNPQARFEVQGHTDNQGSDKINDPLSQQRAESVVKALEGLGVDGFNLRAVGKGSHVPVADNSTADGRAKNRRVEFIKK